MPASMDIISKVLSNPTWDLLVIFFFLAVGFFYGISAGLKRLLSILFSLYVSILLFINFAYLDFFIQGRKLLEVFLFRSFIFFALLILLSILFNKTIFRPKDKTYKCWRVFVLSFLEVGLLMSAIFQLLPAKELFTFSPIVENLFASNECFFWWLTLPLVALFFIVRRQKAEIK